MWKKSKLDKFLNDAWLSKLLPQFRQLAVLVTLFLFYLCFSAPTYIYLIILSIVMIIFTTTSINYMKLVGDQCPWELEMISTNYKVASLHSRLAIITNLTLIVVTIAFIILLYISHIDPEMSSRFVLHIMRYKSISVNSFDVSSISPEILNNWYMASFFKFVMMGVLLSKLYECRLLTSILNSRSFMVSYFTLDRTKVGDNTYPEIYVDNHLLSNIRYKVSADEDMIGVLFRPPISLAKASKIEYKMIKPDADHKVGIGTLCTSNDKINCVYKCRTYIRPYKDNVDNSVS